MRAPERRFLRFDPPMEGPTPIVVPAGDLDDAHAAQLLWHACGGPVEYLRALYDPDVYVWVAERPAPSAELNLIAMGLTARSPLRGVAVLTGPPDANGDLTSVAGVVVP